MKRQLDLYLAAIRAAPVGLVAPGDLARLEDHVADALTALGLLQGLAARSLVDVGTGAGLPGIPLALACESLTVHLVESRAPKVAFLQQCIVTLGLTSRVQVHHERAELAVPAIGREALDVAVCRALAAPPLAAEYMAPFVRPGGSLVMWTTREVAASAQETDCWAQLGLQQPAAVPAPSALREHGCLLVWHKQAQTPLRYPRRPGMARKHPLA